MRRYWIRIYVQSVTEPYRYDLYAKSTGSAILKALRFVRRHNRNIVIQRVEVNDDI